MEEDRRAILRARVIALSIQRGWIVDGEKYFYNFAIGSDGRVEDDLNHLGIAGSACADVLVCRVGSLASHVAGFDGDHAIHLVINGLQTPEAAAAESRSF